MALQEKTAWVALMAMVATFVPYFVVAAQRTGNRAAHLGVGLLAWAA